MERYFEITAVYPDSSNNIEQLRARYNNARIAMEAGSARDSMY